MRRILFINPFGIGDVICALPLLDAVRRAVPDAYVGFWCSERSSELFSGDRRVQVLFPVSRGDIKKISSRSAFAGMKRTAGLLWALRKGAFDTSIDLSLDWRYTNLSMLAGIPVRAGLDYRGRGRFLTKKVKLEAFTGEHIIESYFRVLKELGINSAPGAPRLFISEQEKEKSRALLRSLGIDLSLPVAGIAPGGGASWGPDAAARHWPAEKFAALASRIRRELKMQVILLGDPAEKEVSAAVAAAAPEINADITGRTSLPGFAAAISLMDVMVTNDGGPMHVSVASDAASVSIFGPVDEAVYGPFPSGGTRHIVIKKGLPCRPCYKGFRLQKQNCVKECLGTVEVGEVFSAVAELIPNTKRR